VLGGEGFAREIERMYLRLAGARPVEAGAVTTAPAAPEAHAALAAHDAPVAALGLRHEAAREVGDGALRALVAIRAILGVGARA